MFWCVPAPQDKRWTDFTFYLFFFFRNTAHSNSTVSPLEGDLLTFEKNGGENVRNDASISTNKVKS